ncbi:emp24/gp25L/p24 family protein [Patescibacteria group bacterium]|nr:emp24/gp25L/p24 family protein [Patescibacteria group bacterium]
MPLIPFFLFWFVAQANYGDYYTLKVEPNAENCFYEEVREDGTVVNFDYHVYEGGLLDILVKVLLLETLYLIHSINPPGLRTNEANT